MGINVSILLVTGGWNREIYWWEKYKYQFKGYINYNDTNIEIKSVGWSGNVTFCTQNMVDLSKYNKMYIKFDVYGSCGNYFNDVQVGVMSDIPVAITYNSPAVMNTYSITPEPSTENFNIIYRGDKTNKLVWNSCEYNLDISTIDRAGYIWLCLHHGHLQEIIL